MSNENRSYCRLPVLALSTTTSSLKLFRIYRPNTGLQQRYESLDSLRKKYEKVKFTIVHFF